MVLKCKLDKLLKLRRNTIKVEAALEIKAKKSCVRMKLNGKAVQDTRINSSIREKSKSKKIG